MPLITLEFDDPLFAVAFHPDKPQFCLGFASGKVSAYSYTTDSDSEEPVEPKVLWTTKRHKSSCRSISYSQEGDFVYTAGSDNVIKMASSQTGKVKAKQTTSAPTSSMAVNDSFIAVGDDEGALTIYTLDKLEQKYRFEEVHEDAISSVFPMEHKNKYHFVTAGMSTVAHIDARKGVLTTSEDQEDEILAGAIASDTKCAFGMAEGVLTIWNNEHLLDQQSRVRLSKDTIDCVISGEEDDTVVAGTAEGVVFEVDVRSGKVANKRTHSTEEEVQFLDWDHEYRLATGSMGKLLLWQKDEIDPVETTPAPGNSKKAKRKAKAQELAEREAKKQEMFADL